jgi:hypothetical protein
MLRVSAAVHLLSPPAQWAVHLIDISRAGVAFVSDRPLEGETSFILTFWLPGAEKACTVHASVVYSAAIESRGLYRVGCRFHDMGREAEMAVMDFLTDPNPWSADR